MSNSATECSRVSASPAATSRDLMGARPYLGGRIGSGDEMIDWVLCPQGCGRSVYGGRPAPGALAAGALRELAARHRSDDGQARVDGEAAASTSLGLGGSGGASASSPSSRGRWWARRQG